MATSPTDKANVSFISPKEFRERTGLSRATVYRYLEAGKIPSIQPAGEHGRRLIPMSALSAGVHEHRADDSQGSASSQDADQNATGPKRISGPAPKWTKKLPKDNV